MLMGADSKKINRENARCRADGISIGSQGDLIALRYVWLMSRVEVCQPARTYDLIPPGLFMLK